ncbi:hypothetical protein SUGI_0008760 [Cryptomeria japonica]|nr:hypothetical protein SUGI_0008760 [Cryptomeria japonica]
MSSLSCMPSCLGNGNLKWLHTLLNMVHKKETNGPPPDNLSATFLTTTIDNLLCSYSNLHIIFPSLQQYLLDGNSKWFSNFMEDSIKLLDMCRVVSEHIDEVRHYQMLLQTTIHCVEGIDFSNKENCLVKEINMLSNCIHAINVDKQSMKQCTRLRLMSRLEVDCRIKGSIPTELLNDMSNLKGFTFSVLRIIAKALSVKMPRTSLVQSIHKMENPYHLFRCFSPIKALTRKLNGSCALLHELQIADFTVKRLYDILKKPKLRIDGTAAVEIKKWVENLRKCSVDLENCIDPLYQKINALYAVLINIRVALLDILTYSKF